MEVLNNAPLIYLWKTYIKEKELENTMESESQQHSQQSGGIPSRKAFDYSQLVVPEQPSINRFEESASASIHTDTIYFIEEPHRKALCNKCKRQINKTVCISAKDGFNCVGCFAKKDPNQDPYTVIKSLDCAVINSDWKASQQIIFLNFLEKLGFGNWKQIGQEMDLYGSNFSEKDLADHYFQFYLSQDDYLPKFVTNESFFQKRCENISLSKVSVLNPTSISSLPTTNRQEHLSEHFEDIQQFHANSRIHEEDPRYYEYYNEKRNQFQLQYDQDAQFLLANLEFRQDDTQEQIRIKYRIIDQYNNRVQKRTKLKEFVLEHRLLQDKYQKQMDQSRNKFQKQAFQELKPIARLTTLTEYNDLVRKIAFTKQLKSTIEGLRKLRRAYPSGYKSLDEFLNSQPDEAKPRKKNMNQNYIKTGKKVQQILEKQFKFSKKDFECLFNSLQANGKKATFKNVEAVMLQKNY